MIFFKSYMMKKGDNLATLEDIEHLTSKVEGIKYEFSKMLEADKSKINLLSQRLNSYNSKKDDLIFQIYEEVNQLYNEQCSPNLDIIDHKKSNMIAWRNYVKSINNMMNSIVTKKSKLLIFFNKEEKIMTSIDCMIKPTIQAGIKLNKISEKVSNMNSMLIRNKVYIENDGEFKVVDSKMMKEYIEQVYDEFKRYIDFVFSQSKEFEDAKLKFSADVQSYYENLRKSDNH